MAETPATSPAWVPAADVSGRQSRWYGAPAVGSDIAAFVLIVGGAGSENESAFLLGAAGYMLAAPINHLVRGHGTRALGSLGLRTLAGGIVFGAVLLDVISHPCDGEPSCHHDPTAGMAAGVLALLGAMVVDDLYLARDSIPTAPVKTTLAPALRLGPNLALLSMGGSF